MVTEEQIRKMWTDHPKFDLFEPSLLHKFVLNVEMAKTSNYLMKKRMQLQARQQQIKQQQMANGDAVPPKQQGLFHETAWGHLRHEQYVRNYRRTYPESRDPSTVFRGGSALDQLGDSVKVALTLHLFQHGFCVNSVEKNFHPYSRSYVAFLRSIDSGILPIELGVFFHAVENPTFYHGCIVVELRDYRFITNHCKDVSVQRVLLRPTNETIMNDVELMCKDKFRLAKPDTLITDINANPATLSNNSETPDEKQDGESREEIEEELDNLRAELESRILERTKMVCLDPSVRVMQVANLANYNNKQHFVKPDAVQLAKTIESTVEEVEVNPASQLTYEELRECQILSELQEMIFETDEDESTDLESPSKYTDRRKHGEEEKSTSQLLEELATRVHQRTLARLHDMLRQDGKVFATQEAVKAKTENNDSDSSTAPAISEEIHSIAEMDNPVSVPEMVLQSGRTVVKLEQIDTTDDISPKFTPTTSTSRNTTSETSTSSPSVAVETKKLLTNQKKSLPNGQTQAHATPTKFKTKATDTLLRYATYVHHNKEALHNVAQDVLMTSNPLSIYDNERVTKITNTAAEDKVDATKTTPASAITHANSDAPGQQRVTMQSVFPVIPPKDRTVRAPEVSPRELSRYRFKSKTGLFHEFLCYARPLAYTSRSLPPLFGGVYDGYLRIMSEDDKRPEHIRFSIGNETMKDLLVDQYQSKMFHLVKNPEASSGSSSTSSSDSKSAVSSSTSSSPALSSSALSLTSSTSTSSSHAAGNSSSAYSKKLPMPQAAPSTSLKSTSADRKSGGAQGNSRPPPHNPSAAHFQHLQSSSQNQNPQLVSSKQQQQQGYGSTIVTSTSRGPVSSTQKSQVSTVGWDGLSGGASLNQSLKSRSSSSSYATNYANNSMTTVS